MDILRLLLSFTVGGAICGAVQLISDKTRVLPAKILVSLVLFGIFLGASGIYEPIFELAGAGISVPLIGFGAAVASGVCEAVDEMGLMGALSGPFTAAAAGLGAAFIFSSSASFLFRGKPKNK